MSEATVPPPRVSFVTLGARDLPALRRFYTGLGFREAAFASDEFTAYVLGGVVLALFPLDQLGAEAAPGEPLPPAGQWSGVTLSSNVATREEVDGAWQAWVDAGATPVEAPVDRSFGGRTGYVADPEGNRWELAWAPGVELDERGAVTKFGP